MKRILCITENLGSGGAERQLTGLAVLLKNAGYEVRFITYIKRQFYESYLVDNGVDYELLDRAGSKCTRLYYIGVAVRAFKPDVVISFLPSTNIIMCLIKMLGFKYKLIVSERSHTEKLNVRTIFLFLLYRVADYIVANSYSEAINIKKLSPKLCSKLRTITNFVDTNIFTPATNKQTLGNTINIVSVGRIIPIKNILNYIRAIKLVIDKGYKIKATWIGNNYDTKYYNQCVDLIEELNLSNNFVFKPQTNDIVTDYQKADVFCLPSFYEGFPNVICEAMSCGLPIICSAVCDHPKIVREGENGWLFDPTSHCDISEQITKYINTASSVMCTNNRDVVLNSFSINTYKNSYIELIENENLI